MGLPRRLAVRLGAQALLVSITSSVTNLSLCLLCAEESTHHTLKQSWSSHRISFKERVWFDCTQVPGGGAVGSGHSNLLALVVMWELGPGKLCFFAGFISSEKCFGSLQEPRFACCECWCCSVQWRTGVCDSGFLSQSSGRCFPCYRVLPKCC